MKKETEMNISNMPTIKDKLFYNVESFEFYFWRLSLHTNHF